MGCVSSSPPTYSNNQSIVSEGFYDVANTDLSTAKNLSVCMVFSVDISGSMRTVDGLDRKNNGQRISRFDAVCKDINMYLDQLVYNKRLFRCHLILFGEGVYVHKNVRTEDVNRILNEYKHKLERYTRTDLAVEQANVLYREFQEEKIPSYIGEVTFFNHIMTDGAPTSPTMNDETLKGRVADLLVEGMDGITKDTSRTTLFHQYGCNDFHPQSATSLFLSYLDDSLKLRAKEYFRMKYPDMNLDSMKDLFDIVDCGKQCSLWEEKDPLRRKKSVNPRNRWDDQIFKMVEIATCD